MPRSINSPASKKRRKRIFKKAKGFRGGRKRLTRTASESIVRSMAFATRDRKLKKRTFRQLWIIRLNAACRACDISYSQFINALSRTKIMLNRKILSEVAVNDFDTFKKIVATVQKKAA